jgi:hypothetical protein
MLEGIVQRDPAELNSEIEDRERELYAQQTGTDIHVPDLNITANMLAGAVQTEHAESDRVQNTGTGFLREMRETILTALHPTWGRAAPAVAIIGTDDGGRAAGAPPTT